MTTETYATNHSFVERTTLPRADWIPYFDRIYTNAGTKEQLVTDGLWPQLFDDTELDVFTTAYHGLALLIGPPGTGKTTLAKGVANEIARRRRTELEFNHVHVDQLFTGELGETPKRVAHAFTGIQADAERGVFQILLLDEIGSLLTRRDELSGRTDPADVRRAVTTALQAVDDLAASTQTYCLGTSNQPNAVDTALVDRADRVVTIDLTPADRTRLFLDVFNAWNTALGTELPTNPEALDTVVEASAGLSGRQLRKAVQGAVSVTGEGAAGLTYEGFVERARAVTYEQVVASVERQRAALEATDRDFLAHRTAADAPPGETASPTAEAFDAHEQAADAGAGPPSGDAPDGLEVELPIALKPRLATYDETVPNADDLLRRVDALVGETLARADYAHCERVEAVLTNDHVTDVVADLLRLDALTRVAVTVDDLALAVDVTADQAAGDRLDVPAAAVLPTVASDRLTITFEVTAAGQRQAERVNAFRVKGPVLLTVRDAAAPEGGQ